MPQMPGGAARRREILPEVRSHLLNVDGAAAQRLQSDYSAYSGVTQQAGTYPGQTEKVQTVGVKAVLLASNALPAKQVQQLTQLLFSSREGLEEQLGIPLDPEENACLLYTSSRLYPRAYRGLP